MMGTVLTLWKHRNVYCGPMQSRRMMKVGLAGALLALAIGTGVLFGFSDRASESPPVVTRSAPEVEPVPLDKPPDDLSDKPPQEIADEPTPQEIQADLNMLSEGMLRSIEEASRQIDEL